MMVIYWPLTFQGRSSRRYLHSCRIDTPRVEGGFNGLLTGAEG
jgi:hypothetical protein